MYDEGGIPWLKTIYLSPLRFFSYSLGNFFSSEVKLLLRQRLKIKGSEWYLIMSTICSAREIPRLCQKQQCPIKLLPKELVMKLATSFSIWEE